jgi:antibiotic biosynthesis monooxygenase (ABM) superfamily enzyme
MIIKILIAIISFIFSLGFTLIMKPHIGVYVESKIILTILQVVFTIVGFGVIYQLLYKKIFRRKFKNSNSH